MGKKVDLCYNLKVMNRIAQTGFWQKITVLMERAIAVIVLIGVVIYILMSIPVLAQMDWTQTTTFYELIYRALIAIIGLELVRMLITHSIAAVLELLAFVIARKMLKPELTSLDIILSVVAFVALMAARHYFAERCFDCEHEN